MIGLGFGFDAGIGPSQGADANALAYFAAASVTDATAKTRWEALVTGLKTSPNNANWNNLYELWCPRSGYANDASATLKGIKLAVDLTVNTSGAAPSRGALGMTLVSATGHYLSATISKVFSGGVTMGDVVRYSSTSPGASRIIEIATAAFGTVGGVWGPFSDGNGYADILTSVGAGRISGTLAVTANQHHAIAASSVGTKLWRDATQIATGGTADVSATYTTIQIGRNASDAASFNGIVGIPFIFQVGLTQAEFDWFRQLLKDTIGNGLSMI